MSDVPAVRHDQRRPQGRPPGHACAAAREPRAGAGEVSGGSVEQEDGPGRGWTGVCLKGCVRWPNCLRLGNPNHCGRVAQRAWRGGGRSGDACGAVGGRSGDACGGVGGAVARCVWRRGPGRRRRGGCAGELRR